MKEVPHSRTKTPDTCFLDLETTRRIAAFLRDPVVESPDHDSLPQMSAYEVHEHLGTGGSGSVYMAIPKAQPESVVAIKLFRYDPSSSAPPARILRELDLLSALQIPCVPRILDYGIDQGRFFITTEVVRGMVVDRYCQEQKLDREQRIKLLADIASAVQQLHELGVIHRDLKPSNIMITDDGKPVLIDFGIATMMEETQGDTVTAEGLPIGSPGFMAPEQARGDRLATTIRSDVYALGAMACYLLTGETPHDTSGPLHEVIRRVAEDRPRSPVQLDASLPKPLAAIIAKATAHDSSDRFNSAAELASHWRMWLNGEPFALASPSVFRRFSYRCRRNPWAALSMALASIAVLAAVYFGNVALAESRLADERAQLAEARKVFGEDKEAFALRAKADLERVRSIVTRFIGEARNKAEGGEFGEALALTYGIDHLLEESDFGDAALPAAHREVRVATLVELISAVYRTNEHGGAKMLRTVEQILHEFEQTRQVPQPHGQ